jgi:hypothetical protein
MGLQQITGNEIAADSISASDLANASITGAKISSNTISNTSFQTGSVENYLREANLGFNLRNRIINGAMVIDQRNAGAVVTPNNTYTLDRWQGLNSATSKFTVQQNAGSVTTPAGFANYLGVTSSSAYSLSSLDYFALRQPIEGYNIADLGWGTANAKTVTFSFQVYSSLTGTFGGVFQNNGNTRSYPFTYTISSANTWTPISITIVGDTGGTWNTTNNVGIWVTFGLGVGSTYSGTAGSWSTNNYVSATGATSVVGTNGATFYITGVQLEVGSTATSFDYRPYGTELNLCLRYYYKLGGSSLFAVSNGAGMGVGRCTTTTGASVIIPFLVPMRARPSALEQSGTASDYIVIHRTSETQCSSVPTFSDTTQVAGRVNMTVASGLSAGDSCLGGAFNTSAFLAWSSEL